MEIERTNHKGEVTSTKALFKGATGEEVRYEAKTSRAFDED